MFVQYVRGRSGAEAGDHAAQRHSSAERSNFGRLPIRAIGANAKSQVPEPFRTRQSGAQTRCGSEQAGSAFGAEWYSLVLD